MGGRVPRTQRLRVRPGEGWLRQVVLCQRLTIPYRIGWKNFGETTTEEGHKVFFSGKEDKHEDGVGFLVHKDIVNTVMGCRPVSSRPITIRLRAVPFNITIVQAYVPTSDYDDNKILDFHDQLQNVIDQTPKKDILVVQGDCWWKLARHLWTLLQ